MNILAPRDDGKRPAPFGLPPPLPPPRRRKGRKITTLFHMLASALTINAAAASALDAAASPFAMKDSAASVTPLFPTSIAESATPPFYPTVWGGSSSAYHRASVVGHCSGHLFAFSGLDGPTDEEDPLIAIAYDNTSLSLLCCRSASHLCTLRENALRLPAFLRLAQ